MNHSIRLGAYVASREAQVFGRDEWHRKHHCCSAGHDQNTATWLHRSVECGLNADQSCLHIGVPDGRELVPVLLVDRLYRQPRAGVEDQHVGHLLADDLVHKGGVGCVAGNHRSTGMLGRREIRSSAANCDYVRAAGSERLHHREPQPLAAAGDDPHVFRSGSACSFSFLRASGVVVVDDVASEAVERGERGDPREVSDHIGVGLHRLYRCKVAPLRVDEYMALIRGGDEAGRDPTIETADDTFSIVTQEA